MGLKDYSRERIGKVWGEDDHLHLILQLRKIDEVARAIFESPKLKQVASRHRTAADMDGRD